MALRKRISKVVAAMGLALGLAVLGGSVIGGIALATDRGDGRTPAVTDTSSPAANEDSDDQADDPAGTDESDDVDDPSGTESPSGADDSTEADDSSDADDHGAPGVSPSATVAPHHDDEPDDD